MVTLSHKAESHRKVLVTGAGGFVGKSLVAGLRAQGCGVNVLARKPFLGAEVQVFRGTLAQSEVLEQACAGVDTVFHLAAYTHVNRSDRDAVFQVNVDGTAALLAAAVAQNVRRVVFFSSSLAAEESEPTVYGESKRAAEQLLLQAGKEQRIEVCCLRPVNVYGPGMKGNLKSMIRLIKAGIFPPLPASTHRLSLVGVEDLCQAAMLAAESPLANGRIYPVTDGIDYAMQDIERSIRKAFGRRQPSWTTPLWCLYGAALVMELAGRVLRLDNTPGLRSYRTLTAHNPFSNEKISHDLGYNPRASFSSTLPQILAQETQP